MFFPPAGMLAQMFNTRQRFFALFATAMLALTSCVLQPAPPPATPSTSLAGAQQVKLIVLPDDGESVIADRLALARARAYVKIYLLTDTRIIDSLKRAKANGADVKVMIEEDPFGGSTAARTAFERLKRAGINVKYGSPAFRFTHEKSYVIDDSVIIMTANATRTSVTRNREFGIIRNDAGDVNEVVKAFNDDWNRAIFALPATRWCGAPSTRASASLRSLVRQQKRWMSMPPPRKTTASWKRWQMLRSAA